MGAKGRNSSQCASAYFCGISDNNRVVGYIKINKCQRCNHNIISDFYITGHIYVLTERAIASNSGALLNMAEVPYFCSFANFNVFVNER